MSQSSRQRGRAIPNNRSPLPIFYGVIGLIAVTGIVLLAVTWTQRATPPSTSAVSVDDAVRPLNAPTGVTEDGFAYKGDPNAPVKVIEYADFQCPACGNFFRLLEPTIDQQYIASGQVQYIFHDFPLSQHANAIPAAEAARCAGDQGAFWPMHDLLFSRQREWSNDRAADRRFTAYAQELQLDTATFEQCLASDTYVAPLQQAALTATEQMIQATPTFVVNGQPVPADQLPAAIEAALAGGS